MEQKKAFPIYNQYIQFYKKKQLTSVKQKQDNMNIKQEKNLENKYMVV